MVFSVSSLRNREKGINGEGAANFDTETPKQMNSKSDRRLLKYLQQLLCL